MPLLEKILRWTIWGSLFALLFVPLIVADGQHFPYNFFFPYITGKNFVFRILIEIMAGAYLALALVDQKYRPKRSWILGALAIFVFIIALADVFGVNAEKSIWSNFERMDGLVTLVHVLVLTTIASVMLHTERLWRYLVWTSLGVSAYLSLYGLAQLFGAASLSGGTAGGLAARVDATFGNPIYLAAYMLFHIFLAALLWAQQWHERRPGERLPLSLAYGFIILLDTAALLFSGTRGTILGLAGGALLAALLTIFQNRRAAGASWRLPGAILGVVLLLTAGIWAVRDSAWVHSVGFLGRLATISLEDNTVKARFINWSIAWQGVKERPILGWGQENYAIVFDKYYDPRMYAQEPWFDRVHNIVFDWLVAGGFLGLLAYLAIFAVVLGVIWKQHFTSYERSILTGLLAAYFCHNFFVFDNVTSYLLFAFVLAYVTYRSTAEARRVSERTLVPQAALPYTALGGALVAVTLVLFVNARPISANLFILKALAPDPGGITKNLESFETAIAYNTFGTQEAREQLAQAATQVAAASGVSDEIKQRFVLSAVTQMKAQETVSPLDARFPLFLGTLYEAAGDSHSAMVSEQRALMLSPKKQTIFFQLAGNALAQGNMKDAIDLYRQAFELAPDFTTARFLYAGALIRAGREAEAETLIAPYVASGEAADPRILAAYVARQEYLRAAPLWAAKVKAQPQDAQSYFTLAAIYYEGGDRERSIQTLQQAKAVIPSVADQADSLIQQIRSGTVQI